MLSLSGWPRSAQRAISRTPVASIQRVISRMKPVCSANGMNCIGGTMPRAGSTQRTSASAPSTRPLFSPTLGCRNRRSSLPSTARRSSLSSDSETLLRLSIDGW